ncbi:MAG: hypothetical protein HY084_10225 [Gemmatimonadetes bacterium]|nr:hypothetical protein [Gemmatimonadota bacterium]
MKPSRRILALTGAILIATLWSCGREVTGPVSSLVQYARGISFNTIFPTVYQQAASTGLVAFTKVRVVLHHADGSPALDTLVDFPSGSDALTLSLSVPLLANSPATGETMALTLGYINAAGQTVFSGGPVNITAVPAGLGGGAPPPPVNIPVTYTGPGYNAAAVRIAAPKTRALTIGDPFTFTANAVDGAGNPIPGTPIVWVSADPTIASMTPTGSGAAVARGTARIVAQLLNGPADTATVSITAKPQSINAQSGDGQSALTNATLAAPIVARVLGTDNLPVSGVAVTFAVTAGGGSVGSASATTDAGGLAQTTWKLGATAGPQSVTATAAGIATPATFSATATLPVPQKLVFTTQPVTGLTGAVVVQAQDNAGNLASGFTGAVTLALGGGTTGATLGGTVTVNAVAGVATFGGLAVSAPGKAYTLTATSAAAGLTAATSTAFDILVGPPAKLVFLQSPASGSEISALLTPNPKVAVQDAFGNLVTTFTGPVTLGLAVSSGASLRGLTTVNAVAGIATFTSLAMSDGGTGFVLRATSPGLTAALSTPFDLFGLNRAWNGSVSSDWNTPANWTPAAVPTSSDAVTIGNCECYSPTLSSNVAIASLTFTNYGSLTLGSYNLTVSGDVVTGNYSGTVTGTGTVTIGGNFTDNYCDCSATWQVANTVFTGVGKTIFEGNYDMYSNLTITGSMTLTHSLYTGSITVTGRGASLDFGTEGLTAHGDFSTQDGGVVKMTGGNWLDVYGNTTFAGGSTDGLITNSAYLYLLGHFTQSGAPDSFAPDATVEVEFEHGSYGTAAAPLSPLLAASPSRSPRSAAIHARNAARRQAYLVQAQQRAARAPRLGFGRQSSVTGAEGIVSVGGGLRNYFGSYMSPTPQIISFSNSGEGPHTSHFGEVEFDGGTYSLASDLAVLDEIEAYGNSVIGGGGHAVVSHGTYVTGYPTSVTFDNVPLVILDTKYSGEASGYAPYISHATFQNGAFLDITRSDAGGISFSNLTFTGALNPSSGAYLFNRGSANISLTNVSPLDGIPTQAGQHWWRTFGSGTVSWPVYAP